MPTPGGVRRWAGARIVDLALLGVVLLSGATAVAMWAGGGWAVDLGWASLRGHDAARPAAVFLLGGAAYCLFGHWPRTRLSPAVRFAVAFSLALLACGVVAAIALGPLRQRKPIGDSAVLEIYTLHALRGPWPLGPYSQYSWNHPGPLLFYLVAPLYAVSKHHSLALALGALLINLFSIAGTSAVLARTPAAVGVAVSLALSFWLLRFGAGLTSIWNPHVVLVPLVLLIVLAAAVASGRLTLLPLLAVASSFAAQTHVGLVPLALALSAAALGTGVRAHFAAATAGDGARLFRRTVNLTAWVTLGLWLLPISEQITGPRRNLGMLYAFFTLPAANGQPPGHAVQVWAEMLSAALRPGYNLPVGWGFEPKAGAMLVLLAVMQTVLLPIASWRAAKGGKSLAAALGFVGWLASLVALWSVTRIDVQYQDHSIFWISAIGILNWGVLAGLTLQIVLDHRTRLPRRTERLTPQPIAALVTVVALFAGGPSFYRAVSAPSSEQDLSVQRLVEAIVRHLDDQQVSRPWVKISGTVWGEGAGVVLQLYKLGIPIAVDERLEHMYGAPLTIVSGPTGGEIRFAHVSDPDAGVAPGETLIAREGGTLLYFRK